MQIGDLIHANDRMQTGYSYRIEAPIGDDFAPGFAPFPPIEMLAMEVFEGKYLGDCRDEFPASWFEKAKLSDQPTPSLNYFGAKSRQPLST